MSYSLNSLKRVTQGLGSKLVKRGYIRDYIREYYRGYQGGYWEFRI